MPASRMMHEIANCIPENMVIVDDSVTTRGAVFENIEFNAIRKLSTKIDNIS